MPEVAESADPPLIKQFSLYMENRLGVLRQVLTLFSNIDSRLVAINILETSDSAIIRTAFDNSDVAREIINDYQLRCIETELLVVSLPPEAEEGITSVCTVLFAAEVSIMYAYPLLVRPMGRPALALRVEHMEEAARALERRGFTLMDELGLRRGF